MGKFKVGDKIRLGNGEAAEIHQIIAGSSLERTRHVLKYTDGEIGAAHWFEEELESYEAEPSVPDAISPKHYSEGMPDGIEVIDIIRAQGWDKNFYLANAAKYLLRSEHKGSKVEDLKKLMVYVQWEIDRLEAGND
jgi:hypothetical protein